MKYLVMIKVDVPSDEIKIGGWESEIEYITKEIKEMLGYSFESVSVECIEAARPSWKDKNEKSTN